MGRFQVGNLVQYIQGPERLGVVTLTHTTVTGAHVCEVIVVHDTKQPDTVGSTRYSNEDYWKKEWRNIINKLNERKEEFKKLAMNTQPLYHYLKENIYTEITS